MVFALSPDEQSVLLVHERGHWKAVGGAVDAGESVVDTAVREMKEESGAAQPTFNKLSYHLTRQSWEITVPDQQSLRRLYVLRLARKERRTAIKLSLAAAVDLRSDADDDVVVLVAGEMQMEDIEEEEKKENWLPQCSEQTIALCGNAELRPR